jgi:hypothetical protein
VTIYDPSLHQTAIIAGSVNSKLWAINRLALELAAAGFITLVSSDTTPIVGDQGKVWLQKATSDASTGIIKVYSGGSWVTATPALLLTHMGGISAVSPALMGTPTAPTAGAGTATTQIASTAFVTSAVNTAVTSVYHYKGVWDASAGTFPGAGTAAVGDVYTVSVAGTVGGIPFAVDDDIVAIAANASTTVYASNWHKDVGGLTSARVTTALGYTPASNAITVTGAGLATGGGALTANEVITVTASTNAQAITGTDTTTAMTPASTAAALGAYVPSFTQMTSY